MEQSVDEITVADPPEAWAALGFTVEAAEVQVGSVKIKLAGPDSGRGILNWSLHGVTSEELDGLPTKLSNTPQRESRQTHPNGVTGIDHVVVFSPQLERTIAAFGAAGVELRRLREEPTPAGAPRQAFFRLGEVIVEVIDMRADSPEREADPNGPARLWGIAFVVNSMDTLTDRLGSLSSEVREAIQPGRQIVSLRRSAGLSVPLAFMTPKPISAGRP